MTIEEELRTEVERRLRKQEELYGFQLFLPNFLSDHPDLFLAYTDLSARLLVEPKHLNQREVELAAISASTAMGSEHCLTTHITQAINIGITKEEIVETMMIASLMSMTRGLATAFRKLDELE
ncbi:MAG: carboxymuconolactone decarboxylase family protein [Euryarchaeota archaeon]|nr:carboxymuconolactone decarboxylase family protein [Euryarchaeota archaeon]